MQILPFWLSSHDKRQVRDQQCDEVNFSFSPFFVVAFQLLVYIHCFFKNFLLYTPCQQVMGVKQKGGDSQDVNIHLLIVNLLK